MTRSAISRSIKSHGKMFLDVPSEDGAEVAALAAVGS
jgi:hypothetical protein